MFSALGIQLHFSSSEHLYSLINALGSVVRQAEHSACFQEANHCFSTILANSQVLLPTPVLPPWCHYSTFLQGATPPDTHLPPFLFSEKPKCKTLAPLRDFSSCLEGCSRLPPGILGNEQKMPP